MRSLPKYSLASKICVKSLAKMQGKQIIPPPDKIQEGNNLELIYLEILQNPDRFYSATKMKPRSGDQKSRYLVGHQTAG
jgi:hypothetical protein